MVTGFNATRAAVLRALQEGDFKHEARDALEEKNLLAIGAIEAADVVKLVRRTRSAEYEESPHHWDPSVGVHTFKPTVDEVRWYIKAYFLDQDEGTATFISVHRVEE